MYQHPLVTLASMNDAGRSFRVQYLDPSLPWPVHSAQGTPAPEVPRGFLLVHADEHKVLPAHRASRNLQPKNRPRL